MAQQGHYVRSKTSIFTVLSRDSGKSKEVGVHVKSDPFPAQKIKNFHPVGVKELNGEVAAADGKGT